jgi:hypothetical protein
MREFNRRSAGASGTHATPAELRDATQRHKELQDELRQMELAPETRNGEDRLDRYERELRLRAMREDFQAVAETPPPQQRGGVALALVMTVASFLLCAFCAGGTYFGLILLNQKPDARATADGFWSTMESPDYLTAHDSYLTPVFRFQLPVDEFNKEATAADASDGRITSVVFKQQTTSGSSQSSLTYQVTRAGTNGKPVNYTVTLTLQLAQNAWGISDLGKTLTPPAPAG